MQLQGAPLPRRAGDSTRELFRVTSANRPAAHMHASLQSAVHPRDQLARYIACVGACRILVSLCRIPKKIFLRIQLEVSSESRSRDPMACGA